MCIQHVTSTKHTHVLFPFMQHSCSRFFRFFFLLCSHFAYFKLKRIPFEHYICERKVIKMEEPRNDGITNNEIERTLKKKREHLKISIPVTLYYYANDCGPLNVCGSSSSSLVCIGTQLSVQNGQNVLYILKANEKRTTQK